MPLTAQHAGAGVLDATADPLGEDALWEAVHRARPRAPLTAALQDPRAALNPLVRLDRQLVPA